MEREYFYVDFVELQYIGFNVQLIYSVIYYLLNMT